MSWRCRLGWHVPTEAGMPCPRCGKTTNPECWRCDWYEPPDDDCPSIVVMTSCRHPEHRNVDPISGIARIGVCEFENRYRDCTRFKAKSGIQPTRPLQANPTKPCCEACDGRLPLPPNYCRACKRLLCVFCYAEHECEAVVASALPAQQSVFCVHCEWGPSPVTLQQPDKRERWLLECQAPTVRVWDYVSCESTRPWCDEINTDGTCKHYQVRADDGNEAERKV